MNAFARLYELATRVEPFDKPFLKQVKEGQVVMEAYDQEVANRERQRRVTTEQLKRPINWGALHD